MKAFISCKKFLIIFILMPSFFVVSALLSLSNAATITVVNLDGAGEGFNDTTPFTPVGGNPATTLGQARLNAFQHAADIWGNILDTNVEVLVDANFDPLSCNGSSATLGGAGAITVHRDFIGAPVANTWYPQALANALNGSDLSAVHDDIGATFNSDIDNNNSCLSGTDWYYGYDKNGGGDIDFVSIVLHEIGHGLGFQTFVDLLTGAKFNFRDDTYMLNLEHHGATPSDYPSMTNAQRMTASKSAPDLHWTGVNVQGASGDKTAGVDGDHVQMYGPNPAESGSSVSHFNTAVSPDELMEPIYTGPNHDPGLAVELFLDISWPFVSFDFFCDSDYDGHYSIISQSCIGNNCVPLDCQLIPGDDCDDSNPAINPETYWYQDNDGDGFGTYSLSLQQCNQPTGPPAYVLDNTDYDDGDPDVGPPTKIDGTPPAYYLTLQEAYNESTEGDTIQCLDVSFSENLTISIDKSVTLEGGYDGTYLTPTGSSTLQGDIDISEGVLTIENFILE